MKRLLAILLIILIPGTIIGCSANTSSEYHEEIVINLPKDDTVNGYRLEADEENNNIVSAEKVTVEKENSSIQKAVSDSEMPSDTANIQYCANTNSMVFHKTTCGSSKTIKEENKYITSNRDELIADGYSPCKKCNP